MMKLGLSKTIELINFNKIDDETNICVLYDSTDQTYSVAFDLQIKGGQLVYSTVDKTPRRFKAEKKMEDLTKGYLIDKARRDKEASELARQWELFKNI